MRLFSAPEIFIPDA